MSLPRQPENSLADHVVQHFARAAGNGETPVGEEAIQHLRGRPFCGDSRRPEELQPELADVLAQVHADELAHA